MSESTDHEAPTHRASGSGGAIRWALPLLLMLLILAAIATAAGILLTRKRAEPLPTEPIAINVHVEEVVPTPAVADTLVLPGVVEPERVVDVAAEVEGRISAIPCEEGAFCPEGEVLVQINTEILQAECDRATAQAAFDEREYKRLASLAAGGAATERDVDEARSHMEISRAVLAVAAARLARAEIKAPISGVVDEVPVDVGEYVFPGTHVARIVNLDVAKVIVNVPEREVHYLGSGKAADVHFRESAPIRGRRGSISLISQIADERTRTTRVEIAVDNGDRALRSGEIVRVRFTRRVLKDVIMVPLLAIIPVEGAYQAYVVEDGIARARDVALGRVIQKDDAGIDRIQIVEGLSPGDRLIVAGHRSVADGQRVRVVGTGVPATGPASGDARLGR